MHTVESIDCEWAHMIITTTEEADHELGQNFQIIYKLSIKDWENH